MTASIWLYLESEAHGGVIRYLSMPVLTVPKRSVSHATTSTLDSLRAIWQSIKTKVNLTRDTKG